MCAFPKTKLRAGVPCLPSATLAMNPGRMGGATPRQRGCRLAPPQAPSKKQRLPPPTLGFLGLSWGRCGAVGGWLPALSCLHLRALPAPPGAGGAHGPAEPPGDVCSAPELCLILWFAQAEQTPSFLKVLENVWPKLSQLGGQAGGGLSSGCGRGARPAPPSSGGAGGRWERSFL